MWSMMIDKDNDDQIVDLDYLEQELLELKEFLQIPYIDRRAKDDDIDVDPLEELKTAFNEISQKEKTLKQVLQVFEFVLRKYNSLTESYKEVADKFKGVQDEMNYKESVIESLNEKIERAQANIEEMEKQSSNYEKEIKELKKTRKSEEPEKEIIQKITAMEQRVRRQSLLDNNDKINGLEIAMKTYQNNCKQLESTLEKKEEIIKKLRQENKEMQGIYEKYEHLQHDVKTLTQIKASLETEFTEAVESRENEIEVLKKYINTQQEEIQKLEKNNTELDIRLSKFSKVNKKGNKNLKAEKKFEFKVQDVQNNIKEENKNGDQLETQDSNGEELDKRIDDQIEMVESESDGENFFDNSDNFTLTIRNRITNENLADLMSSYKGIQDDDERDLVVSHHVGDDLIRYFDRETQTDNHNRYNYEEEEKYCTNIQDYSMDLKIEEIGRNNESINASSILNPKKKKDSLEEYFKMTVLAMKIAHHDLDSV